MSLKIRNLEDYNARMHKSLYDKAFAIDYIDEDVKIILDYGCADGALTKYMAQLTPEVTYIGYDPDPGMVDEAYSKGAPDNCLNFIDSLTELSTYSTNFSSGIINLSSVLHEIVHYGGDEEVEKLTNFIKEQNFKYVAIRDFYIPNTYQLANPVDVAKVRARGDINQIASFEEMYGSIGEKANFLHFLLKYTFTDNWEREVREDYSPYTIGYIYNLLKDKYDLIFYHEYILPYTKDRIFRDFEVDIKDTTHMKMVLKRRN